MIDISKEVSTIIIINAEENYFKKHGRYAQMLTSLGHGKPDDQKEGWTDLCVLPKIMQTIIRVDVYEGPKGHGFIIIHTKDNQEAAINQGPENRSFNWRVINEQHLA